MTQPSLSVEELMLDRYKVIANYPEMERHNISMGDILTEPKDKTQCVRNQKGDPVFYFYWDQFPAIFKKLEWWQERDPKDLPLFLKDKFDRLFKVRSLDGKYLSAWLEGDSFPRSLAFYTPCH